MNVAVIVRDGEEFLEMFCDHYLQLGVDRITVLDNGSVDRTLALATRAGDRVEVLRCHLPFSRWETAMKSYLLRRAGRGRRWVLLVDIDELFDYPGSDVLPLEDLVNELESNGFSAMATHLLDVFPAELDPNDTSVDPTTHRNYELKDVVSVDYSEFAISHELWVDDSRAGGLVFQLNGFRHDLLKFDRSLWLTKHALVHPAARVYLSHPHLVQGATVAPTSGVLVHYSLTGRTVEKARAAIEQRRYGWSAQDEYSRYLSVLDRQDRVQLRTQSSKIYASADHLVSDHFLQLGVDTDALIKERRANQVRHEGERTDG